MHAVINMTENGRKTAASCYHGFYFVKKQCKDFLLSVHRKPFINQEREYREKGHAKTSITFERHTGFPPFIADRQPYFFRVL